MKEESAGRPNKAFVSRNLGCSCLRDLKAGATRTEARAQDVEETWCEGEDRFSVVTFSPPSSSPLPPMACLLS